MKYFTMHELTRSSTADLHDLDNIPDDNDRANLIALVDNVLDPLRKAWGSPIYVNSGYRSDELNKLVGGVKNSEHRFGRAADIDTRSIVNNKKLFKLAIALNLPFRQIILEEGGKWVHISYNANDIKREILYT